jgi:hypothetical protein
MSSFTPASKQIDCGRHDIAEIKGDQIRLEKGWIITGSLEQTKSGWQIIESGNIYPALPF